MRHEFEYWYPMDLRCSGKDLIRNHLTMSLYNHAAIWEKKEMMPKSIFCNGYLVLNGEKMSKSTGNFMTIRDSIAQFGVDATRITLADAGDSLDDANFETEVSNAAIMKLFVLEEWITKNIKATIPDGKVDFASSKANLDMWDNMFINTINRNIELATQMYDKMQYKQAVKYAFYELQAMKEDYLIAKGGKANPFVLMRYLEVQLMMMNPIVPHFAQYCWDEYVYPIFKASKNYSDKAHETKLFKNQWPLPSTPFNKSIADRYNYMKKLKSSIRDGFDKAKTGGKKAKKGKVEEKKEIEKCYVFVAKEYPEFQKKCLVELNKLDFDEENKPIGDHIAIIREAFPDKKQ